MPAAPDSRSASPEAPAAPLARRNPPRDRRKPERLRQFDLNAMTVSDSPVNDTPTVEEALASPQADMWIEAMNAELASLHSNQTWECRAGDTTGLAYVKQKLSSVFKLKDLGEARCFLGMQLVRDRAEGTILISQQKLIHELVTTHNMSNAHSKTLPMPSAVKLVREGEALDTSVHHYSALVGSLLYLSCCTRPDIAFSVGALARHMSAPTKQHWAAACTVLCYLKGTSEQGLLFGGVTGLQGFTDADYAGDKDTARSTTGYLFTLNGGAISWSSRLQPTVAMSTAEAEYMAASSATKEALWLRKLMRDLQLEARCVQMSCDNQAALQLLHNPMATARAKHIDVHHHFVRERITRGEVAFSYCHTDSMLANIFTKPLAAVKFNTGKQGCGVFSP
ncbi:reverse transcriptase Ty1/copia-type domain-containing protein [Haematococcus lacustris]|uniref:Reverse transcriptase Ty1/copia-type domain-containing protein n=1 Tax=Haematococcus lacustris TaxID=44745 RepID=A0A6A0AGP0_HAELA|nr:reverse transcriptase Ty1/copia-type domain-containing protein [Haematococcus lacustris]